VARRRSRRPASPLRVHFDWLGQAAPGRHCQFRRRFRAQDESPPVSGRASSPAGLPRGHHGERRDEERCGGSGSRAGRWCDRAGGTARRRAPWPASWLRRADPSARAGAHRGAHRRAPAPATPARGSRLVLTPGLRPQVGAPGLQPGGQPVAKGRRPRVASYSRRDLPGGIGPRPRLDQRGGPGGPADPIDHHPHLPGGAVAADAPGAARRVPPAAHRPPSVAAPGRSHMVGPVWEVQRVRGVTMRQLAASGSRHVPSFPYGKPYGHLLG
jgi:hypothetical protein